MAAFSNGPSIIPLFCFFILFGGLNSAYKDQTFVKDLAFSNHLPTNGGLYYIDTKGTVSISHCAMLCTLATPYCAGVLFHINTGTCHILRSRLYESSVNFSRIDAGWEYFAVSSSCCDQRWHLFDGHCYRYVQTFANWNEAKDDCKNQGGYLAIIETEMENTWIKETFLPAWNPDTCVSNGDLCCNLWVGASDLDREGMFQWINNNSLTFTHWFPGEPNGGGNEDCLQLCNNGQWNDESCSNNENALCEKEL
ncbi:lectin BRA-3-like [Crassostrea angulata]|uniref:lectin BRA-3-like n=1 Tax=Magallana angulata TaxID=2784310 RepID=UPI0022B19D76|nr:lectin BRA-3-like [Crassostrea angulata]